jgi:hypothetical protein
MKNSKQVMVRMPPFLYEQLKQAADMTMTTPSAMARILIKQQLDGWDLHDDEALDTPEPSPTPAAPTMSRQERRRKEREARKPNK